MQRRTFLAAAASGLIAAAASAVSSELNVGMAAYHKGDFNTAAAYLSRAVRGAEASNAAAHYYLADSLLRTRKVSQAVTAYRTCLSLRPGGQMEAYCLQALKAYDRSGSAAAEQERSEPVSASAPVAEPIIDVSRLPRLSPAAPISLPSLAEINSWSLFDRANFYNSASSAVALAGEQLEESKSNLKKAESILHSSIPAFRDFGESEAHFNARARAARSKVDSHLAPFEAEVDRRAAVLQQARQILEVTIQAKHFFFPGKFHH